MKESGGDLATHRQMKLFTALATAAVALAGFAAPAEANTYTHFSTYGDIHCKSTLRVYGKHSFSSADCTNFEERASRARARKAFIARVKQQEAKMGISCSDYSKTAGQANAVDDGFTTRVPSVYVKGALLHCQIRVQGGYLPDGVSYAESAEDAAKNAPGCTDPSIGAATKKAMGCV